MFKEDKLDDEIIKGLLLLNYYIHFKNKKQGQTDANRKAEPFFAGLLNIALDEANFIAYDRESVNTPAIDLGDINNKCAVQLSSDNSYKKIKKTVVTFEKDSLQKEYDKLSVLIIGKKKKYNKENLELLEQSCSINGYELFIFDIYDMIANLVKKDMDTKEQIVNYIHEQLDTALKSITGDSLDDDKITPWNNANRYRKYLSKDIEDKTIVKESIDDIEKFSNVLGRLPKAVRNFLYLIVKNKQESSVDDGIKFDSFKVIKKFNQDSEADRIISTLKNSGFKFQDLEENNLWRIWYKVRKDSSYDALSDLCKFCEVKNVNLKAILIDLRFDLLD